MCAGPAAAPVPLQRWRDVAGGGGGGGVGRGGGGGGGAVERGREVGRQEAGGRRTERAQVLLCK